jgi:hypothetical protein
MATALADKHEQGEVMKAEHKVVSQTVAQQLKMHGWTLDTERAWLQLSKGWELTESFDAELLIRIATHRKLRPGFAPAPDINELLEGLAGLGYVSMSYQAPARGWAITLWRLCGNPLHHQGHTLPDTMAQVWINAMIEAHVKEIPHNA